MRDRRLMCSDCDCRTCAGAINSLRRPCDRGGSRMTPTPSRARNVRNAIEYLESRSTIKCRLPRRAPDSLSVHLAAYKAAPSVGAVRAVIPAVGGAIPRAAATILREESTRASETVNEIDSIRWRRRPRDRLICIPRADRRPGYQAGERNDRTLADDIRQITLVGDVVTPQRDAGTLAAREIDVPGQTCVQ